MNWFQNPKAGVWLHSAAELILFVAAAGLAFATTGDPLNLGDQGLAYLGLATVLVQGLLSGIRNAGMNVVTTKDSVTTTGESIGTGDVVITVPQSAKTP